jgi:hypothetical protein
MNGRSSSGRSFSGRLDGVPSLSRSNLSARTETERKLYRMTSAIRSIRQGMSAAKDVAT